MNYLLNYFVHLSKGAYWLLGIPGIQWQSQPSDRQAVGSGMKGVRLSLGLIFFEVLHHRSCLKTHCRENNKYHEGI